MQRSVEQLNTVLEQYCQNLKDIEGHIKAGRYAEAGNALNRFVNSKDTIDDLFGTIPESTKQGDLTSCLDLQIKAVLQFNQLVQNVRDALSSADIPGNLRQFDAPQPGTAPSQLQNMRVSEANKQELQKGFLSDYASYLTESDSQQNVTEADKTDLLKYARAYAEIRRMMADSEEKEMVDQLETRVHQKFSLAAAVLPGVALSPVVTTASAAIAAAPAVPSVSTTPAVVPTLAAPLEKMAYVPDAAAFGAPTVQPVVPEVEENNARVIDELKGIQRNLTNNPAQAAEQARRVFEMLTSNASPLFAAHQFLEDNLQSPNIHLVTTVVDQIAEMRSLVVEFAANEDLLSQEEGVKLHKAGLFSPQFIEVKAITQAFERYLESFIEADGIGADYAKYETLVKTYTKFSEKSIQPFIDRGRYTEDQEEKSQINAIEKSKQYVEDLIKLQLYSYVGNVSDYYQSVLTKAQEFNAQLNTLTSDITLASHAKDLAQRQLVADFNVFFTGVSREWKKNNALRDEIGKNPYVDRAYISEMTNAHKAAQEFTKGLRERVNVLKAQLQAAAAVSAATTNSTHATATTAVPLATAVHAAPATIVPPVATPPAPTAAPRTAVPPVATAPATAGVRAGTAAGATTGTRPIEILPQDSGSRIRNSFKYIYGETTFQFKEQLDQNSRLDKEIFQFSGVKGVMTVESKKGLITVNDNNDAMLERLVEAVKVAAQANPGKVFKPTSNDKAIEAKLADMLAQAGIGVSMQESAPAPQPRLP